MIQEVDHRPWPVPAGSWVMAQVWHDLLFAHWPIATEQLRPHIPPALDIDTYDGQAWIGVVPFRMSGVRLCWMPELPWLSAFPELNVRTYVTAGGKPGVFFFSLDAANPVAVVAARRWYHLPYMHARMECRQDSNGDGDDDGQIVYSSRRTHRGMPPAVFEGTYRPTGEVLDTPRQSLAHWLTERYCLYAGDKRGRLFRAEINHPVWPLQWAEAEIETNTMTVPYGIQLPDIAPLLHFSRRQDVVVWPLQRV